MEPIWATLLAKALEGKNVKELLSNVGAGGGAPASGPAVPAAGGDKPAAEEKEEKKEEKEEESDEDMVRSLVPVLSWMFIDFIRALVFSIDLFRFFLCTSSFHISKFDAEYQPCCARKL
jgi:hypothetical protein